MAPNLFAELFFLVPIAIGELVVITLIISHYRKIRVRRAWPQAVGKITEAHITRNESYENSGANFSYAFFTFTYQVSGSEFRGKFTISPEFRLIFQPNLLTKALAELPVGTTIPVRYDPQNPQTYMTRFDEKVNPWLWYSLILLILFFFAIIRIAPTI